MRGVRSVAQLVQSVMARSMHICIKPPVTSDDVFLVNVITRNCTPQSGNPLTYSIVAVARLLNTVPTFPDESSNMMLVLDGEDSAPLLEDSEDDEDDDDEITRPYYCDAHKLGGWPICDDGVDGRCDNYVEQFRMCKCKGHGCAPIEHWPPKGYHRPDIPIMPNPGYRPTAAVGQVEEGKPDTYLQSLPKPRYGLLDPTLLRPDEEPASWWARGGGYTPMVPPGYISPREVERNWRMRRYHRTQPPHLKGCDNAELICEEECPLKPHNQRHRQRQGYLNGMDG